MKKILCIEILERDPDTDDVKVIQTYPFDLIPYEEGHINLPTFKIKVSMIEDRFARTACENRLHFILTRWHPKNFVRVGTSKWKYDEEYYKNLSQSTSKGGFSEDE